MALRIVRGPLHARPQYTHCCKNGVVRLPLPLAPPTATNDLFEDSNLMENVRAYNNMFSKTSFGARIDDAVNDGHGPYVFKVSSQVSHWIGSICPPDNEHPRFLQLYIYDTENEVPNRLQFFQGSDRRNLSPAVVRCLADTLKSSNEYARLFTSAKDLCDTSEDCHFSVRLYNNLGDRRYEPPASGTLGGIVYADDPNACNYDIVVHNKGGTPQRVSKLHPSYIPFQYPLLFPFAEPGCFQIHDRHNVYSLLLRGGRLFQQYLVDAYTCIEQSRLDFVNANQNIFRSEFVAGLYDALARGDNNAHYIGKRVLLPSSFTGGPRYMYKHYQDALAICRVHGNPQYFITFTCNVKWPEISRHLEKIGGALAQNRPDIISRVFRIKVQQFLRFMRSSKTFGEITAGNSEADGDCIEATADVKHIEHFDSVIQLLSCYKVSGYIATGPRTYMATVDHTASLVIGQKARFYPAPNLSIPDEYFNFATYYALKTRIKDARLLTDYIGRVKTNSLRSTRTGKILQKTLLRDEMKTEVEITLWPEKLHLIGDEVIPRDIVAITLMMVTEHNGHLQLESTYLTTAFVNPDMPQTIDHINR
ncbi:hypothetical protein CASFOL_017549 [Castilleja foliolosa]|uniref:Helitron helicase-like domain-containing protein n=1 Tax=Castilleja foliolosa TaxID=1961234 RepID=A0ABD3DCB6_9LAMI